MATSDSLLIRKIISNAAGRKATDIHLTVGNYPFLRVEGNLMMMAEAEILKPEILEKIVDFFLTSEQQAELVKNKEITIVYYDEETSLRFRINVFYQKGYPAVSLKLVPTTIPEFSSLGLPKVMADFSEQRRGLVIISGPFSSGRSTTLASLIQLINQKRAEHIITLEKPIEYLFVNEKSIIDQREVGRDVDSFANGLKTILDEDVNIVAVTDASSPEIFESSLELAESGRLVFLLMNSDSVISVLEKIVADFTSDKKIWALNILSEVLIGVVIQRLIPKINGGMALACEILTMTPAVKSILKEGKFYQLASVLLTSRGEGMVNLDKSLIELVKKGIITKEEALREAQDKESFQNILKNIS